MCPSKGYLWRLFQILSNLKSYRNLFTICLISLCLIAQQVNSIQGEQIYDNSLILIGVKGNRLKPWSDSENTAEVICQAAIIGETVN